MQIFATCELVGKCKISNITYELTKRESDKLEPAVNMQHIFREREREREEKTASQPMIIHLPQYAHILVQADKISIHRMSLTPMTRFKQEIQFIIVYDSFVIWKRKD